MSVCLVTGAAGFLGSAIVEYLSDAYWEVRATDRKEPSTFSGNEFSTANILEFDQWPPLARGSDCIVHAAGLAHIFDKTKAVTAPFKAINEQGTANVARAAAEAGVRHFILISSVSVYGPFTQGVYDESAPCRPNGPYAESKYQAEQRAIDIAQRSGMALTILRLATLYGEGDPGNVARLMRTIDRGRFIWLGDGSNRKSLLYKGDAARAILAVLQHPPSGINIYNVTAPPCTMRQVVDGLATALDRRPFPLRLPATGASMALGLAASMMRGRGRLSILRGTLAKWLADDVYDASRFERTLNFRTRVSLSEGLQREVAWYRSQNWQA
jgi:nucleoside-diphosphate-sugar epimerase